MTRFIGPSRSGRRRRTVFGALVAFMLLSLLIIPNAFAVHDLDFQLDADVNAATLTHIPPASTQHLDWDSVFTAAGANVDPLPVGITAATFEKDFNTTASGGFSTTDSTTYATGSKDTLPITPGWQCNRDANVNSKIDIMNAYAAAYTAPNGDDILYFALERNTNTGDANVGFWFLQGDVACDSPGGNTPFTGDHVDGDLLIVSAFTNGGNVSTIDAYRWNGGANGSLGTTPVAHGVDCRDPATGANDPVCAVSNRVSITTPWLTATKQDGVGHTLRTSDFFEGGLNLTQKGLGGKCFNTFTGVTRSSQSLTATLFDFALGQLGECKSTTVTTPSITGSAPIPTTGTLAVTDSALVTVDGADTFSGDVTFYLCGPDDPSSTTTCDSGGVQIGSPQPVSSSPATVVSDAAQLTSAGRYCWRADFSGDDTAGVPPSSDSSESECFTVTPLQPSLTTQATSGPVPFGESITDTVALSGTANQEGTDGVGPGGTINATRGGPAGGTIDVTVYGPDSCSTVAHGPVSLNVSGDGSYGGAGSALEFTPSAPGEYVFVASYTGDLPNTLGIAAIDCASQPSNEKVTVQQVGTDIKTKQSWYPNDTVTISAEAGNLVAGGSVLFELFTSADCSGSSVYSETVALTTNNASEEVSTNNATFNITTGYTDAADSSTGRFSWKVTYTPGAGDTAHTGSRSSCDSEHFAITYTNDNGPGTDLP